MQEDEHVHSVKVSDYYLSKTEVTQKLWQTLIGKNPSHFEDCLECPVERVSWDDIKHFLKILNDNSGKKYRLPTEAEWEYAAKGGEKQKPTKYSGNNDIQIVAWYKKNSGKKTHPVATRLSNELGLFDMTGNVWEWCQDDYIEDFYLAGEDTDPVADSGVEFKVLRGGGYSSLGGLCRTCNRHKEEYYIKAKDIGFRLAMDPE